MNRNDKQTFFEYGFHSYHLFEFLPCFLVFLSAWPHSSGSIESTISAATVVNSIYDRKWRWSIQRLVWEWTLLDYWLAVHEQSHSYCCIRIQTSQQLAGKDEQVQQQRQLLLLTHTTQEHNQPLFDHHHHPSRIDTTDRPPCTTAVNILTTTRIMIIQQQQ